MAFRKLDSIAPFNSDTSAKLLEFYESHLDEKISNEAAEPSHKTFAASSFRCDRRSWFRLRGTTPDVIRVPDKILNFAANVGTACHTIIQSNLREFLGNDWIDVAEYLRTINLSEPYSVNQSANGLETQVELSTPPIRFACDGIIKWGGKYILLEIKTVDYSVWQDLTDVLDEHRDQAKIYSTLLQLDEVIFIYQDRWYGGMKVYSMTVSEADHTAVKDRIYYVLDMVEKNLAPEGLPKGDKWCSPNYCPYHKKCKEYG